MVRPATFLGRLLSQQIIKRSLATSADFVPLTTNGFVGAVGNTPLIKLKSLSAELGANIYGKAEFMNPGGSVKGIQIFWR